MRKISEVGEKLLKESEGLELTAYRDTGGVLTIGWGHTGPDVLPGMQISMDTAEIILANDLIECYECIENYVDVPLSQGQYDAITDFIFNLGCGAFKSSTLLRLLNQGDYDGARKQFPRWCHGKVGGKLVKLEALVIRRAKEAQLFAQRDSPANEAPACDQPSPDRPAGDVDTFSA